MKKLILLFILFATPVLADSPIVPNSKLTPGMIDSNATVFKICRAGYSESVRNVSQSIKHQVFVEYGVDPMSDRFEIDHLISLELGGSNNIQNLWPQSYTTQPLNAYRKDVLENKLHSLVCSGRLSLATAQKVIATDWISAYKKYVGQ